MSSILLSFTLGFLSFYLDLSRFENTKIYTTPQIISGKVIDVTSYSQSQSVVLTNVLNGEDEIANVSVYITNGTFEIGDKITFQANLENALLFKLGTMQNYIYSNNIHYTATIDSSDVSTLIKVPLTAQETIRKSVKDLFQKYMSDDIAELSYSALFGERGNLSSDIGTIFSTSGISHILSVSGMHVAFLVLLIDFLLKKFKFGSKTRFFIFVIFLAFYVYVCDFQLTVIRASIMSLILLLSNILGKQYDSLNSIGIAGFLILIINPLSAYSIGFQLSFLCVFIIALFAGKLTGFLLKIKLPKKLSQIISLTTCVQLGLLPIIAKYFGTVSLLSIFTNLICIPIFELAFILTMLFILPVMIMPFLGFLITFTSFLYEIVVAVATFIASQNWAIISLLSLSDYALMLFYIAMFFASGYVMMSKKYKASVFMALLIFSVGFSVISSLPTKYNDLTIMRINNYTSETIIIGTNGETILISDLSNIEFSQQFLQKAKINNLDIVVCLDETLSTEQTQFINYYACENVLSISQNYSNSNVTIENLQVGINNYVLFLKTGGHNIMFFNKSLNNFQKSILQDYIYDKDINIIINSEISTADLNADFIIDNDILKTNYNQYNNLNNWLFVIKNGKLNDIRSLNWNFLKLQIIWIKK